jgi:GTP-binding protein YchF
MLADLESLERRVHAAEKKVRGNDKEAKALLEIMEPALAALRDGKPVRGLKFDADQAKIVKSLQLMSAKPVLYVCNVDEASAAAGNKFSAAVEAFAKKQGAASVIISAAIEAEVAQLAEEEEKREYLASLGLAETGLARVIRAGYQLLDLCTFFTVGPKEVHAWTIPRGSKAPQAAGAIHTDFEKGFIRAETIAYDDFVACGGEQGAKDAGKMRLEGSEYVVQDGDVMHFRFNV